MVSTIVNGKRLLVELYMGLYQVLPLRVWVELGVIAMKGTPKLLDLIFTLRLFPVTLTKLDWVDVLTLCRYAVGIFYNPSWKPSFILWFKLSWYSCAFSNVKKFYRWFWLEFSLSLSLYIYIYIYMCVYVYRYIYIFMCASVCVLTCVYIYIYIYIYIYMEKIEKQNNSKGMNLLWR